MPVCLRMAVVFHKRTTSITPFTKGPKYAAIANANQPRSATAAPNKTRLTAVTKPAISRIARRLMRPADGSEFSF